MFSFGSLDSRGVGEIEYERYYNPDNDIFWTSRKLFSEVHTIAYVIICTNIFFILRFFWQNYVLKPVAMSLGMRKSYTARFLENGWYSLYYITFFCLGSYVYYKEEWSVIPTMNIWLGWPIQPFSLFYRYYYLLELSFYIHCTIALFFETKRKDFYQMLTHHIATFFLVAVSYWYRYHRIGLIILILHNISDIFLYSAKAVNYLSKETKNKFFFYIAETSFVLFAVTFLCSRLIFFPFTLIRSSLFEAYYISVDFPLYYPANVALLTLVGLHMFWFFLIIRIVYAKLFKSKDFDDIRSDSDEDIEDEDCKEQLDAIIKKGLEVDRKNIRNRNQQIINQKKQSPKQSPKQSSEPQKQKKNN